MLRLTIVPLWLLLSNTVVALHTVAGSPCTAVCTAESVGSLEDNVVCLDNDYSSTARGRAYKACVACQLNSTAVDENNNVTDVDWALYNMRYTLSECMFAVPEQKVSISSPCQVTCQPLQDAVASGISIDTSGVTPDLSYCNARPFDDQDINACAFCYGFIPQQLYLANFLQALHVACRQPPVPGQQFFPNAITIFNASVIPGPVGPITAGPSSGLRGWKLALAIALPLVGFAVLLAASCYGCFAFTRRRRQQMAASGRMSRLQHSMGLEARYADLEQYQPEFTDAEDYTDQPTMQQVRHQGHSPGIPQPQASPVRDDVGPGPRQVQDHDLHNQYFGTPAGPGFGEAIPMTPISGPAKSSRSTQASPISAHSGQAGPSYAERVSMQPQRGEYEDDVHEQDSRSRWM